MRESLHDFFRVYLVSQSTAVSVFFLVVVAVMQVCTNDLTFEIICRL